MSYLIQSNSVRGEMLRNIMDMVVGEILTDISPMLGPGATDAFLTKNGAPYYTRDGKEVMESLHFDTELANTIHHIFYQAAYAQGKKVGDGTTTVEVFLCLLYQELRRRMSLTGSWIKDISLNTLRDRWNVITDEIADHIKSKAVPLNDVNLKAMLYTCTKDANLTAKLYDSLRDALMAGAYITPRLSNIQEDFRTTVYDRPVLKVTRQFTLKPIPEEGKVDDAVVFYCKGSLDVAHYEVLLSMLVPGTRADDPNTPVHSTFILLCHGTTDATRRAIQEMLAAIRMNQIDVNSLNNLMIYTLDEYRKFTDEELEDVATIITDQPGMGGIINALTYETLLYRAFYIQILEDQPERIDALETFDMDIQLIDKMHQIASYQYVVMFDDVEGMAIGKKLGPHAQLRFNQLREEIANEKSDVRKVTLQQRMRRTFGMFIDVEIGSDLIKDSQRKYELILDAIVSSAEAGRDGVLMGNSALYVADYLRTVPPLDPIDTEIYNVLYYATLSTVATLLYNMSPVSSVEEYSSIIMIKLKDEHPVENFNLLHSEWWPLEDADVDPVTVTVEGREVIIPRMVVEPVATFMEIIRNSVLALELVKTEVFHISGNTGYMNNFIEAHDKEG